MSNYLVRELMCEIPRNDYEWYTVVLERDTRVKKVNAYHINVFYDDEQDQCLVAGTQLYDGVLIKTRNEAFATFNIVVRELMAHIHTGREFKHPLLTMINNSAKIDEMRAILEDLFNIVIE